MRKQLWRIAKFVLFRLDAEKAHNLTIRLIRWSRLGGGRVLRIASGADATPAISKSGAAKPVVLGMEFRSRVGLAAGFDKNAEIIDALPSLGFGFAEIGTVTPRPQPGNDKPRLFRDPSRSSLFNRLGFNGKGAAYVSAELAGARQRLPHDFRVGVNIGKNKDTPLELAAQDYALAAERFDGLADYLVINVSSPNTPGLRSLQTIEALSPIIDSVGEVISRWSRKPPLLLKLAPEVMGEDLVGIIEGAERRGIQGWVFTNTLGGSIDVPSVGTLTGGWSGGALTLHSRQSLIEARRATKLPVISVGGILTSDEAVERRRAGADLVQIYTGWIYGGPSFPSQLARRLREV